jgi:hypothetical protein
LVEGAFGDAIVPLVPWSGNRKQIENPTAEAGQILPIDAISLRLVRQAREDRQTARAVPRRAAAQVGCCRGTLISHRQRDSIHFGCSANHSDALLLAAHQARLKR